MKNLAQAKKSPKRSVAGQKSSKAKQALPPEFTPVPNVFFDRWQEVLSPTAFGVASHLTRRTYGWIDPKSPTGRKQSDRVSHSQICEATGLSLSTVKRALKELKNSGLLQVEEQYNKSRGQISNSYSLNFDKNLVPSAPDPRRTANEPPGASIGEPVGRSAGEPGGPVMGDLHKRTLDLKKTKKKRKSSINQPTDRPAPAEAGPPQIRANQGKDGKPRVPSNQGDSELAPKNSPENPQPKSTPNPQKNHSPAGQPPLSDDPVVACAQMHLAETAGEWFGTGIPDEEITIRMLDACIDLVPWLPPSSNGKSLEQWGMLIFCKLLPIACEKVSKLKKRKLSWGYLEHMLACNFWGFNPVTESEFELDSKIWNEIWLEYGPSSQSESPVHARDGEDSDGPQGSSAKRKSSRRPGMKKKSRV